jgi:hypothetical protein
MAINVPAIALARGVVAPDNREVLWEDTSNMNLPFYERVKSYDSNSNQWRMVTQFPLELLNELRKVDGDGSGLDANFLQGRTVNDIIQLAKDGSFTLPNGFIFIGNTLGNAVARAVSGDATLNNIGTLSLIASGVTAGTYNLATVTVDAKGRVTNAVSYTLTVNDIPELPQSKITGLVTDLGNRELLANKENSVINTSTTKYPTVNLLKIGLDTKEPTITAGTTGQYYRGDKTFQTLDKTAVGLGNVDNTSDANKPISSATQTALDAKLSNIVEDTTPQLGGNLDLNGNDINGTGNVDVTGNVIADVVQLRGGVGTQGEMSWSTDEETIKLIMDGTTLYMGQDTFVHVRNNTASIITKGTAVYATGTLGASGRITVAPMIADGTIAGRLFIGLAAEDIAIGADGQVCSYGKIRGINTNAYNDGDVLWLSPSVAGQLTVTEPTAPNLKIATAFVIHDATNGTLMVRAEQGTDLHSDQRVQVSGLTNNDVLTWNNTNQRWQNAQPTSSNIYTTNGTVGSGRVATLTDTLSFTNGRVEFNTTTDGILLPRLTTAQMNAIASPVTNTILYNTDLNGLYRYNGSSWVALSSGYGIIGVYSGIGNGTPTFFATLQDALETCKASGGYFTVKLFSNITITSAIQIDYTGSGVGFAYQFRQLMIDFNGFSVTNAQANTSEGFDIRLSNNVAVYQEIRFLNGNIFRTNGTGTHHALKINQAGRYGTVQMSNMFFYCQNSISMSLALENSTNVEAKKVCDLGGSHFISQTNTAINFNSNLTTVVNFNALSRGAENTITANNGNLIFFTVENTSTGNALNITSSAIASNFNCLSNSGSALRINTGVAINFTAISVTGIGINANIANCTIDKFYAKTGNNFAIQVLGSFDNNSNFSNGKCENNGATECAQFQNFGSAHNIEAINYGSGFGLDIRNGQESRCEITSCKGVSIGGIGGALSSSSASSVVSVDDSQFISHWNNSGGHALRINNSTGIVLLTKSHLKVRNAGANAINATVARTVNSRYCTHNDVASTPINANVTIVSSGIIS